MQRVGTVSAASLLLLLGMGVISAGQEIRLAECPDAVRKTIAAEAKGAVIETIHKEKEEDETIYWFEAAIGKKTYAIGVLEDGTLAEMNLAFDDTAVALDRCPAAVQATFKRESFGEPLRTVVVGKDMKYGVPIYEIDVIHRGKSYEIVVAEDGTLVEKVLIVEDEEIELARCPPGVQAAFKEHARGGTVGDVTRSTGITRPSYEAEVTIKDKVYLVEVSEGGVLVSKSLEAAEE